MKQTYLKTCATLSYPIALLSLAISAFAQAQEESAEATSAPPGLAPPIEEVLILGRIKSAANDVVAERIDLEVAIDILGAEQISRIGDSTVAAALRRLPGVTLVDDKYVYVRGLGERYSSTLLNGATVPSPDLSRSVIPLDIFPTSIVSSLSVQKVFSSDMPAAFGGGSVDIRTKGIPDEFVFTVEIGSGFNSLSDNYLTYNGGDDDKFGEDDGTRALNRNLQAALSRYRGNFSLTNIREVDNAGSEEAAEINRQLALNLYRDLTVTEKSAKPDFKFRVNTGNVWGFDNGMELGFLVGGSYDASRRRNEIITRNAGEPDEIFTIRDRTVDNVSLTGNLSLGFRLNEDNEIQTTSLLLRNTDDEVSTNDIHNANTRLPGGVGFREYEIRYEQREMLVNQIHGTHILSEDTRDMLNLGFLSFLDGLELSWYYSDAESTTDIPSENIYTTETTVNTETAEVLTTRFDRSDSTGNYRFTELQDFVESYGWETKLPLEFDSLYLSLSGGTEYWRKTRVYEQYQFLLNTVGTPQDNLLGTTSEVFSDAAISDPNNGMLLNVAGDNEDSYIAANKTYAGYTKVDVNWNDTWRVAMGMRWEDYQQVNLPWNPLEFEGNQLYPFPQDDPEVVAQYFEDATFANWDSFGSIALTYMLQDFWAQDFQLRVSYGETTVRPDLREISGASYRDPITDLLVFGNPDVVPSYIDNFDVRAEWFFSNGDNLTISLFSKDITDPIEAFEVAASDNTIALEIINAESGEVSGVEIEFLKSLGDFAEVLSPFFIQGNFTFMESEIVCTLENCAADAPTNRIRSMQGASDTSGNLIFGFDSADSKHAATLSINYFSERLFSAGRNGNEDNLEQPFNSVDLTYSFYPTDNFTIKFKASNLLDEKVEIIKQGISTVVFEQDRGQSYSLSVQYQF